MCTQKILVVDDSEVVLEATQLALEEAGYEVIALDNPLSIPHVLRKENPALVLLDINMPTMRGDEVMGVLRRWSLARKVPILLHSDVPTRELEECARRCGATGFIAKTVNAPTFVRQVRTWLEPRPA